jgi:hypothetical protein
VPPTPPATLTVEAAFGSNPLAASPSWTDITTYVRQFTYQRGRQELLNQMQAGTGAALLRDEQSRFDPTNQRSPYYPNVVPMCPIRVRATVSAVTYDLCWHFVERWPRSMRVGSRYTERSLTTVDGFEALQGPSLAGKSYPAQLSGARVGAVLDDASWPAGRRAIDAGYATVPAAAFGETDETSALAHLQSVVEDGEVGLGYIDGAGRYAFINRHALITAPYTTSQLTVADDRSRGSYVYQDATPDYGKDQIYNDWRTSREGGVTQRAYDQTSIDKYVRRTKQVTVLTTVDAEVIGHAQWRLHQFKDPLQRVASLTIKPETNTALWTAVCGLEIGDRITVVEQAPGFPGPTTADYVIQGLSVTLPIGPVIDASFTYNLWPADTTGWFIFGTASGKWGRPTNVELCTNTNFEVDTAGWAAVATAGTVVLTRDTTEHHTGVASLKVVYSGGTAADLGGAYFGPIAAVAGETIGGSGWFKGTPGQLLELRITDITVALDSTYLTCDGTWQYVQVWHTVKPTATQVELMVLLHGSGGTYYCDDFSLSVQGSVGRLGY